jgi:hypothetical protein
MSRRTLTFVMALSATAGFVVARLPVTTTDSSTPLSTLESEKPIPPAVPRVDARSKTSKGSPTEGRTQSSPVQEVTPILDALLPDLTEAQLESVLVSTCVANPSVHLAVVNELLASKNPVFLRLAVRCLKYLNEPRLIQELVDTFRGETHRGRLETFAELIGSLNPYIGDAHATVLSILDGDDAGLKLHVLKNLNVPSWLNEKEEATFRRLRSIIQHAPVPELRASAAAVLDDDSPGGIAFLMNLAIQDAQLEVRVSAVKNLPSWYSDSDSKLEERVLTALWNLIADSVTPDVLRKAAVRKLAWNLRTYEGKVLTAEQRALIQEMEPSSK